MHHVSSHLYCVGRTLVPPSFNTSSPSPTHSITCALHCKRPVSPATFAALYHLRRAKAWSVPLHSPSRCRFFAPTSAIASGTILYDNYSDEPQSTVDLGTFSLRETDLDLMERDVCSRAERQPNVRPTTNSRSSNLWSEGSGLPASRPPHALIQSVHTPETQREQHLNRYPIIWPWCAPISTIDYFPHTSGEVVARVVGWRVSRSG